MAQPPTEPPARIPPAQPPMVRVPVVQPPAPTSPPPATQTSPHPRVAIVIVLVVVIMLGMITGRCAMSSSQAAAQWRKDAKDINKCQDASGDWVKTPAEHYRGDDGECVAGMPPVAEAPAPRVVPASQRPWISRTLEIPQEGLRVWLEPGSARYPKLGGVKTYTSGGNVYVDCPGVDHDGENNPAGWFTFVPEPPGERRQIEIYNRW